ncbi:hypothetical protein GV828_04165 [Flavobacterium sp. NST-5]|uniref:Uncharacterized protein n=1 Tax=Flavobacterium ichthyis TaxID=2698827 RepID=A0ABW9Z6S4_9FLAO|nr:hypothetical protein [Flavobacterium ichthyis]NBL64396.1 hypothetical protein [Flavobacterium ichthyis]
MKKIFTLLALFLAFAIQAQSTDLRETAKKNVATLETVVKLDANAKKGAEAAFYHKHKAALQENLTAEQKQQIEADVEALLIKGIGEENFAKLKANTKIYNQLLK